MRACQAGRGTGGEAQRGRGALGSQRCRAGQRRSPKSSQASRTIRLSQYAIFISRHRYGSAAIQGHRSPMLKVIASSGRILTRSSSFALANSSHRPSCSLDASRVRSVGSTSYSQSNGARLGLWRVGHVGAWY